MYSDFHTTIKEFKYHMPRSRSNSRESYHKDKHKTRRSSHGRRSRSRSNPRRSRYRSHRSRSSRRRSTSRRHNRHSHDRNTNSRSRSRHSPHSPHSMRRFRSRSRDYKPRDDRKMRKASNIERSSGHSGKRGVRKDSNVSHNVSAGRGASATLPAWMTQKKISSVSNLLEKEKTEPQKNSLFDSSGVRMDSNISRNVSAGRGASATLPAWMTQSSVSSVSNLLEKEKTKPRNFSHVRNEEYRSRDERYVNRLPVSKIPELFSIQLGRVVSIQNYGAFIELEEFNRTQGLVHISHISESRVHNVSDVLSVGRKIWVKVIKFENTSDSRKSKLSLSMKLVDQESGADLDPDNSRSQDRDDKLDQRSYREHGADSFEIPKLFSIHHGKVAKVVDFGAFVSLDNSRVGGLVHISQLANFRVENISEIVSIGSEVWVKVTNVTEENNGNSDGYNKKKVKLSLSMKVVNQSTGIDMDPEHLESQSNSSSSNNNNNNNNKFNGGVNNSGSYVNNTKCTRCNAKGHFKYECFADLSQMKSNKDTYILVDAPKEIIVSSNVGRGVSQSQNNGSSNNGHRRGLSPPRRGLGRGVSATMPAWMTANSNSTTITAGTIAEPHVKSVNRYNDGSSVSSSDSVRRHKSHKKHHKKKSHKKHHKSHKKHHKSHKKHH